MSFFGLGSKCKWVSLHSDSRVRVERTPGTDHKKMFYISFCSAFLAGIEFFFCLSRHNSHLKRVFLCLFLLIFF